jgi:hypothetical protein
MKQEIEEFCAENEENTGSEVLKELSILSPKL